MSKTGVVNNTRLDSGIITATFTDLDGHVFSKFRINPADVQTADRAISAGEYFEKLAETVGTTTDVVKLEKETEEKISGILGYESANDIFGEVHALSILPDGSLFVEHVIEKIISIVKPEVERRKEAMRKRADKYTEKYEES